MTSGQDISIFPNPATGKVNIAVNNPESLAEVRISDLTGKVLYHSAEPGQGVDVSRFSPGIYVFRIAFKDGSTTDVKITRQ